MAAMANRLVFCMCCYDLLRIHEPPRRAPRSARARSRMVRLPLVGGPVGGELGFHLRFISIFGPRLRQGRPRGLASGSSLLNPSFHVRRSGRHAGAPRAPPTCRLRAAYVPPIICYVPLRTESEVSRFRTLSGRHVAARSK